MFYGFVMDIKFDWVLTMSGRVLVRLGGGVKNRQKEEENKCSFQIIKSLSKLTEKLYWLIYCQSQTVWAAALVLALTPAGLAGLSCLLLDLFLAVFTLVRCPRRPVAPPVGAFCSLGTSPGLGHFSPCCLHTKCDIFTRPKIARECFTKTAIKPCCSIVCLYNHTAEIDTDPYEVYQHQ